MVRNFVDPASFGGMDEKSPFDALRAATAMNPRERMLSA